MTTWNDAIKLIDSTITPTEYIYTSNVSGAEIEIFC